MRAHIPHMPSHEIAWFGPFVFDPSTGELSNGGAVAKLAPHIAGLLALLIDRGGTVVTQTELRDALGPGTNAADDSVNVSVRQLRVVLGDEAPEPRFIEAIAEHDYRFIAPVSRGRHSGTASVPRALPAVTPTTPGSGGKWIAIVAALALILLALFALLLVR